jgi:hypothetical protein
VAARFDLGEHVNNAMNAVIGIVAIAIAFGIGMYILYQLNAGTGGNLTSAVSMLEGASNLISTAVTFLVIGVVAGIGIGLVLYLRGAWRGG